MKRYLRTLARRLAIFAAAVAMAAAGVVPDLASVAQDQGAAKATDDAEKQASSGEDLFQAPEGDADALQEYMEKLAQTEPEGETQEEQIAFATKSLTALADAGDKLLAANPSDEQRMFAHTYRIQALSALKNMLAFTGGDAADVQKRLDGYIAELLKSDDEDLVSMGWQYHITNRASGWSEFSDEQKQQFRREILEKIEKDGPQPLDVRIAAVAAQSLDGVDDKFAADLLKEALAKFEPSDDGEVQEAIEEANLEGMMRRLNLPGNQIEIEGTLLSGGEVDWDSYRGKVVLVDFWATWCGPCRAEVPNILEMYHAYHDKGFDVLGVSLDRTPEQAKKYAADMKLPWDSLFPEKEQQREWNHPLAVHYAVGAIPTAILVDKEGKVVSMNARGRELRAQLKKLLGDPVEKPAEAKNGNAEAKNGNEAAAK